MDGISHEESIKEIHNCNSVNWIVGHIVYYRNSILAMLNMPPMANESMKEVYGSGVLKPDMKKAVQLDTLKKLFLETQTLIMAQLEKENDEAKLEKITFLGVHETYHIGQIGLLRKLLGMESAIK